MKDLVKSSVYQLLRSKVVLISVLIIFFTEMASLLVGLFVDNITTMGQYIVENSGLEMTMCAIAAVFSAVVIVGGDFHDKTANYEIMSGHTRKNIYFGKAVLGILIGCAAYVVTFLIPILIGIGMTGFGNVISGREALIRFLISILVTARIICVFICITYMVKNHLIVMAFSGFYFMFFPALTMYFEGNKSIILGLTSYIRLSDFLSWITYSVGEELEIINIYDARLSGADIMGLILSSLLIGIFTLLIGYSFFKRDDIS